MYYFDPSFGYIHVTGDAGSVRYGRGPVAPHDPSSITDQRYTRFEGWVEIQPHYVPDAWLLAFRQKKTEAIKPIRWGWREASILAPIWSLIFYITYKVVHAFL